MNRTLSVVFILIAAGIHSFANDQIPAPPQAQPILLSGATVHTVSGDTLSNADILFEDGTITAIGQNLNAPSNAERIDVSGKHIYPALIAMNTNLGLVEINAVRATRDAVEVGPITPEVRAAVAFNPDSELIPVTRSNGIALAQSTPQPGWGGKRIAGRSALMELDGWTWENMAYKEPLGLHIHWPGMLINRSEEASSRTDRNDRLKQLTGAFDDARAYLKAKEAAESNNRLPVPDTDVRWEAMSAALQKKNPVYVHANHISQLEAAISWSQKEDLDIIFVGASHAWMIAERLAELKIPVVIDGTQTLQMNSWQPYDTAYSLPGNLYKAGVKFAIGFNGRGGNVRNLPYHASAAAAYGLPKDEALKSVTLYPAQIMGVADRLGSLETGKDATLIVTDGDPLEVICTTEHMFIQGRKVDLSNRHTMLYEKYRTKYRQTSMR